MSPLFARRRKSAPLPPSSPSLSLLERRIEEIMARAGRAGGDHAERAAALEEYVALARAHEGESWFEVGAHSEDLANSWGYSEGAEMLCELAEKLMRSGDEPKARPLWEQARSEYPMTCGSTCRPASSTSISATTARGWNG